MKVTALNEAEDGDDEQQARIHDIACRGDGSHNGKELQKSRLQRHSPRSLDEYFMRKHNDSKTEEERDMKQSRTESKSEKAQHAKPVGMTAAAGFQIGVRRTLPSTVQQAWSLLISPEGMELWIGEVDKLELKLGQTFAAAGGITGEFRVVKPPEQLRMRWKLPGWEHPSTLQIRVLPAAQGKATVSFHQEKLEDMSAREAMKSHWEEVLASLRELADQMGSKK